MDDKRNIVLFVLLSALILIGWTFLSDRFLPTANPPATKVVDGKSVPLPKPQADPTADSPAAIRNREVVLKETPRIAIETPRLKGSLNLKGARIDDLVLTQHTESIAKDSPPIRLLSPAGSPDAYFAEFGWTGDGLAAPNKDTLWTASGSRLAPGAPLTLRWDNGKGQVFEIVLSVDDGYLFTARQRVANRAGGAVAARPYSLVSRATASRDPDSWTSHVGPLGVFNGKADYDTDYKDLAVGARQPHATTGGWLGFGDKYWLTALIPDQGASAEAAFTHGRSGSFQADLQGPVTLINPGRAVATETRFFAGAKEIDLLEHYQNDLGITEFERAIDWGWFGVFMAPIFKLLRWLYAAIGNFGLAIICLTMIVRALMFPIANKQFKSMAAMRVLQPKMKALQERYKDDKPKLQQEMLKLYQEEKVNPMAGCLPILIQIPIFYALYKTLMVAVEMRHKPFVLWIKDLSAPDPLTPVNLFGYLDFTPPSFLALGVLPILLGVTMWLQFKLNPPQADPVQQQVFGIMPWVLMFVMAPFAAGLQLYWTVNNILTIIQQKWLYSRHPGMKAATAPVPETK
ncbi:membrane protein insertase YidC [Sphingomonas parva]|uniref:Membrane protein insertase YidC n=1 Tax=Sphingomonas parva TaxID=2555898 RepID=A0A4Y8ZQK6_9SPHN|nr:membrane protein insertase YidC [Sphingomonas parva]TFI57425.1 membrane protein insertase YidC [Sphingomonas parva]